MRMQCLASLERGQGIWCVECTEHQTRSASDGGSVKTRKIEKEEMVSNSGNE